MEHLGGLNTVKELSSVPAETVIEDFRAAAEVIRNKEDRDKPMVLIERASNALRSIDVNSKHFREDRVASALTELYALVQSLQAKALD